MTTIGDLVEIFKVIFELFSKLFKILTKDKEEEVAETEE